MTNVDKKIRLHEDAAINCAIYGGSFLFILIFGSMKWWGVLTALIVFTYFEFELLRHVRAALYAKTVKTMVASVRRIVLSKSVIALKEPELWEHATSLVMIAERYLESWAVR